MTSVSTSSPGMTTAAPRRSRDATSRWMHELAGDGGRRGDVRVRQADLGLRRAHPPPEVAVRGRHRPLAGGRGRPCRPPKQAPQVGRRDTSRRPRRRHRAGPRASPRGRCAASPGRRSRGSRDGSCGRAGSRPPGGGRSSSRSSSCRCTPGRSSFRSLPRPERRCPARCGSATRGRAPTGRSRASARRPRRGRRPARRRRSLDACAHGHRDRRRPCRRREQAGLGAGLDRHVRDGEALVDRERLARRRRRTRARRSCAPPTPISPMTARIRSLPVTNRRFSPVNSTRIVDGTACQNSPSARQAAMSVDPRPVPKAPRAPYVQVCESPPAITVPGTNPALLAQQRVLDAAASLVVERHALRIRPLLQPPLQLRRARVLRRARSGPRPSRRLAVEDPLHAHPLERAERDRAADVVRHDDVAAHHHHVARRDVVGVGVREQDLLSERVPQRAPPGARRPRRPRRRRRTSRRCRTGSPRAPPGCGRRPPRAGRRGR